MDIRYKDLLKAIRALGSKQAQEEEEEEHPMDTVDEHWGEEEDTEAEHMITCYEGKTGRPLKKETVDYLRKKGTLKAITARTTKEIRDALISISLQEHCTMSDYIEMCIKAHISPETILHKETIIETSVNSPIKDRSRDLSEDYIGTKEACEALSVARTTIGNMAKRGDLPCIRVGREYIFKKKDIKAYLRSIQSFLRSSQNK